MPRNATEIQKSPRFEIHILLDFITGGKPHLPPPKIKSQSYAHGVKVQQGKKVIFVNWKKKQTLFL